MVNAFGLHLIGVRSTFLVSVSQIVAGDIIGSIKWCSYLFLQALIEKDWLRFGHKFTERCGLVDSGESREVSPIFTQFLDCTRHLLELLPGEFEFNSRMLLELHDHSRSGLFGTFVGCCEKDRYDLG